jgi:hypothetical protein
MSSMLTRYNERLRHRHGWAVELTCPACGVTAVPAMNGWTPSLAVNFGNTPTVYANLRCPSCGADLRGEAGEKLVELFAGVPTPPANRRLLAGFVARLVGVMLVLMAGLYLGVHVGWWGYQAFQALTLLPMLVMPLILWLNWRIASLRFLCECGKPDYDFMGLLGRSYCYRCHSCGRPLRLRD